MDQTSEIKKQESTHFCLKLLKLQRGYEDNPVWETWYLPKKCPIAYDKIEKSKNLDGEQKKMLLFLYDPRGHWYLHSHADVCFNALFDDNECKKLDNGLKLHVFEEDEEALMNEKTTTYEHLLFVVCKGHLLRTECDVESRLDLDVKFCYLFWEETFDF